MSFKLSALLNPASEPSSPKPQQTETSEAPTAPTSDAPASVPPPGLENASNAIYDAADALAGLAHGGPSPSSSFAQASNSAPPSNNEQSAQLGGYSEARRTSSYGSVAAPVEPSTVDGAPQQHSPSLEQYHHRSKSPEEQRRQSLMSMSSNPTILPPIHTLEGIPERRPSDQAQPSQSSSYGHDGHDASQIVSTSPVEPARVDALSPNAVAQSREPDYVREEPTTAQVRVPSPNHSADPTAHQPSVQSPTPQVKLEPTATSREQTPAQAALKTEQGGDALDVETLKAIASARNEHSLRGVSREDSTATSSAAPAMDPDAAAATVPKKRKPVESKVKKKGPGGPPKSSNKKRKIEEDSGRPSPTPSAKASKPKGSKKSQTGTPVAGSSPAPHSSPPPQTAEDDDDEESGSDDGIYCICRKGDNHTWMIACDGSCQDWYHGKCVNVKESDGDLIEKYFCPRCSEAGEGRTTWKRMCRRDGCRRPARREEQSKYCSEECGVLFMKGVTTTIPGGQGGSAAASNSQKSKRDRRKANHADSIHDGEDTEEDGPSGPRGGALSARDLKSLVLSARDVDHFKSLGNSILSPPATASPSSPTFKQKAPLSGPDAERVATIETEIRDLTKRVELLKDRESFVAMAREQAGRLAEREGVKPKDICGYDSRLNWSEGEFALWRSTPKGRACLRQGTLEAEPEDRDKDDVEMTDGDKPLVNGTSNVNGAVVNGVAARQDLLPTLLAPPDLCLKKRCQRHTQWGKIAQYDVSFELSIAKSQIQELVADERDIRHRALVGWRKEMKSGGEEAVVGEDGEKEGWVEVLG